MREVMGRGGRRSRNHRMILKNVLETERGGAT